MGRGLLTLVDGESLSKRDGFTNFSMFAGSYFLAPKYVFHILGNGHANIPLGRANATLRHEQ